MQLSEPFTVCRKRIKSLDLVFDLSRRCCTALPPSNAANVMQRLSAIQQHIVDAAPATADLPAGGTWGQQCACLLLFFTARAPPFCRTSTERWCDDVRGGGPGLPPSAAGAQLGQVSTAMAS